MGGRSLREGCAEVNAMVSTAWSRLGPPVVPGPGAGHEAGSSQASDTWAASAALEVEGSRTEEGDVAAGPIACSAAKHPVADECPSDAPIRLPRHRSERTHIHASRAQGCALTMAIEGCELGIDMRFEVRG